MPARRARPRFERVVFDADSTLSSIEGIDELARLRGVALEVAAMTGRAMRGEVALESVYARRLALVKPGAAELARVAGLYVRRLVPGAAATVASLLRAGVDVRVVSGGLRPALLPLMSRLGLSGDSLHAVDVMLDARGRYRGFDELSPLARGDGKRLVLERLRGCRRGRPTARTVLIGDGATDVAARPAVDCFIAFAGVAERPAVAAGADHVARSFAELRRLLALS